MKLKNIVRYGAVAALMALTMAVMVSCQKQEPAAESEPTDTQLMQEAAGDAKAPFYVLVVGNDSRVGTTQISLEDYADGTGRSDTMMLVRVDPVTYKITLVTVPRDTEADYEGSVVKINELYRQGGMEAAVEGVESLTGVHVQYYLDMGFVGFEKFVDQIGGVTANVPIDMHLKDIVNGGTIELNAGTQELDGPEALVLARVRKLYAADIEACRQIQDRQLVEAGIRIYEYTPGFIHSKTVVCDDQVATVGTINFDFRSLYLHFECATLLYRTSGLKELKKDCLDTIEVSREITLKDCKQGIIGGLFDSVLRVFAPLC